jgi:hypothetical protein
MYQLVRAGMPESLYIRKHVQDLQSPKNTFLGSGFTAPTQHAQPML